MNPKLLIVDDEPHIRESVIRKIIPLNLTNYMEAQNGKEAFQLISTNLPDIVITDIRMPEMDGIDLIAQTREQIDKKIIFIILSGYDLFEYAQKAISLGAFAFILKPINQRELESVLHKALAELSLLQGQREEKQLLEQMIRKDEEEKQRQLLLRILSEDPAESDVPADIEETGITFRHSDFVVIFIQIDGSADMDLELFQFCLENVISELFARNNIDTVAFEYPDGQGFLLNYSSNDSLLPPALDAVLAEVKSYLERYFTITVGVGMAVSSFRDIHASYTSALHALSQRMIKGTGNTYYASAAMEASQDKIILDFDTEHYFLEAMERQDKDAIISMIRKLYTDISKEGYISVEQLSNMNYQLILLFYKILNYFHIDLASELEDELTQYREANMRQGINEITDFFEKLIENIFTVFEANKNTSNQKVMNDIKKYILSNYGEDLSLTALSDIVHLTPSYISKLFKSEFQENLSDFITDVRIRKAKEMLKESYFTVKEIGEQVGFCNTKYFYKIFKKYTGMKPSEYRSQYRN